MNISSMGICCEACAAVLRSRGEPQRWSERIHGVTMCPNCAKIVKAFLALHVHAPEEVTA